MRFLVLKAYLKLIYFDFWFARGNFSAFYDKVRFYPLGKQKPDPEAIECICAAVDMACIWYRKEVLCLQRSAAAVCMLREYGVAAQMVTGTQIMPHKTHAWVEVDGRVVNDKTYVQEVYTVMDRC